MWALYFQNIIQIAIENSPESRHRSDTKRNTEITIDLLIEEAHENPALTIPILIDSIDRDWCLQQKFEINNYRTQ